MRVKLSQLILVCCAITLLLACQPLADDAPPLFDATLLRWQTRPSADEPVSDTPILPPTAVASQRPLPTIGITETPQALGANPLADTVQDLAQLGVRGLAEGYVVLYCDTSRAETSLQALMEAQPGQRRYSVAVFARGP